MRLFIDTVANRFPTTTNQGERFCVRVCLFQEHFDGYQTGREEILIRPNRWVVDAKVQPYLRATPEDLEAGMSERSALQTVIPYLRRASEIVAFNADFHQRTLDALFRVNGMALSDITNRPWTCMMKEAGDIMRIPSTGKRWKSPTLQQADEHFSGTAWRDKWIWDEHAAQTIFAVRRVYRAARTAAHQEASAHGSD